MTVQSPRDKELGIKREGDVAFTVEASDEEVKNVLRETNLVSIKPEVLMTARALLIFIGEDNNEVLLGKMQAQRNRGKFVFKGKKGGRTVTITRHTQNLYSAEEIC
jgi:hypothetical protein